VDISTREVEDKAPYIGKNPAAVELGRLGGLMGDAARKKIERSSAVKDR